MFGAATTTYIRAYMYANAMPNRPSEIMLTNNNSAATVNCAFVLATTTGGSLRLDFGSSTFAGLSLIASTTIATGTWNYLELETDRSAAGQETCTGRLNGTQFGSAQTSTALGNPSIFYLETTQSMLLVL